MCICAAFRLPQVTEEQSNECEYPASGSVRFQPEQISAVTDLGRKHFQPDRTNTTTHNDILLCSRSNEITVSD